VPYMVPPHPEERRQARLEGRNLPARQLLMGTSLLR
jgi:hypothetical protein